MQQALLDGLEREQTDVDAARECIDAILEYYSARAAFPSASKFVYESHVPPFAHGMDVLLTHAERGWISPNRVAEWFHRFEESFECGDFRIASVTQMDVLQRLLPLWEKLFGPEGDETAAILTHLGILYYGQGRHEEAKVLYQRALGVYEKSSEPDGEGTAAVLGNLGVLYVDEERHSEALPMLQRALEINERIFGTDHPKTAGILDGLGVLWAKEWQISRARELFERALAIYENTLESDNPNIAATRYNISNLDRMEDMFFEE